MNATDRTPPNADRAHSVGTRGGRRAARLVQRLAGTSTGNARTCSRLRLSLLALSALLPLAAALPSSPASAAVLTTTTTPAVVTPAPVPNGMAGPWTLKFSDEFNGTALDQTKWQPGWYGSTITSPVNSSEKQCFDSRQATVSGGSL